MSNVCERAAVYDCRCFLQCLYQVWFQCIFQKSCHSSLCIQVTCGNRFLLCDLSVCIANDDFRQSFFQVCDVTCQTQNCHDLRSNGDVITIFSWHSVCLSAKAVYYVSQLTVVHIHTSLPCDLSRVNVQCVALENVVVDHGCQQVVCCTDRMEVTCEVKVDIFHRNYLSISAAGCSAFYTEYRSK